MHRIQMAVLSLAMFLLAAGSVSNQVRALADCPNAPATHLAVGMRAMVTVTPPGQPALPVRVHATSSTSSKVLGSLKDGDLMTIIAGPVCAGQYMLWQVTTDSGITGWLAEADRNGSFVEPASIAGIAPTLNSTAIATHAAGQSSAGKIAFVRDDPAANTYRLYVINPDGSGLIPLTDSWSVYQTIEPDPVWSPDGTHLLYVNANNGTRVIDSTGASAFLLKGVEQQSSYLGVNADWSPDGKRVVFSAGGALFLQNADSSNLVQLIPAPTPMNAYDDTIEAPRFSPDGSRIIFEHGFTPTFGLREIITAKADGTNGQKLLDTTNFSPGDGLAGAQWSPDGHYVAFLVLHCPITDQCVGMGTFMSSIGALFLLPDDGSTSMAKIVDGVADFQWSPDGKHLAYTKLITTTAQDGKGGGNATNLYIADVNGANPTRVNLDKALTPEFISWSPDSQNIAFSSGNNFMYSPGNINAYDGKGIVEILNIVTGQVHKLTDGFSPAWQPLGESR